MIQQISRQTGASVRAVCAALALPRSSFYHAAVPTASQGRDATAGARIEAIFKLHRRRYGYRRIRAVLSDSGFVCAPARIRRLMAARGLRALPRQPLRQRQDRILHRQAQGRNAPGRLL